MLADSGNLTRLTLHLVFINPEYSLSNAVFNNLDKIILNIYRDSDHAIPQGCTPHNRYVAGLVQD